MSDKIGQPIKISVNKFFFGIKRIIHSCIGENDYIFLKGFTKLKVKKRFSFIVNNG